MQKTLFIKLSIIAGLCAFFLIGLGVFRSVIIERQNYAADVIDEISQQHVSPQTLINPFIIIPRVVKPDCHTKVTASPNSAATANTATPHTTLVCPPVKVEYNTIFPKQTQAKHSVKVSQDDYQRGIYRATSYSTDVQLNQRYDAKSISNLIKQANTEGIKSEKQPRLIIPVSDLRGVTTLPNITIGGQTVKTNYPTEVLIDDFTYLEAIIPDSIIATYQKPLNTLEIQNVEPNSINTQSTTHSTSTKQPPLTIAFDLSLSGMGSLSTIPTGSHFDLAMQSDWITPNFIGDALPNRKTLNSKGFNAGWQNQYLTVNNNQKIAQCLRSSQTSCFSNALNKFSVDFAEPNDVYLQTERSLKYGLLLILVSFGTFFLFEVIKSRRIHPIQYLLVGSALVVFYVLLLPLAEQVAFVVAYSIAATACVGLIGWYAYYMLGTIKRAVIFTVILGGLYAAFYGILTTEDLNLLFGAIFCFALLASVMVMTRKIDWYKIA